MDSGDDSLVGLRFEVSGGLGRMSGRIVGKAGALYLVRKEGANHLELLALDDLRSAKFYVDPIAVAEASGNADSAGSLQAGAVPSDQAPVAPGRKRLADQIRKRLTQA
jgi:hypothetical protein